MEDELEVGLVTGVTGSCSNGTMDPFTEKPDPGSVLWTGRKCGIDFSRAVMLVFHRQWLLFWILATCFGRGSGRKLRIKILYDELSCI